MNPLDSLHIQLRLEGLEIVTGDRLRQVVVLPGEDMPLMLLAQLSDGQIVAYYNLDLSQELYLQLTKRMQGNQFAEVGSLVDFLKTQNISVEVGHYKTYLFPKHISDHFNTNVKCFSKSDPRVEAFGFDGFAEQVYGIQVKEKIVSACVSTRENDQCGEAWVYTDPQYRRSGFAWQVVCAWAQNLLRMGKVPFYSHKIENTASASLAKRIGLLPAFEEIAIQWIDNS